jgi:hypothetical protein
MFKKHLLLLMLLPLLVACSNGSSSNASSRDVQEHIQTGKIEIHYTLPCAGVIATSSATFSAVGDGYAQQQQVMLTEGSSGVVSFSGVPVDVPVTLSSNAEMVCQKGDRYDYQILPAISTIEQLNQIVVVHATPRLNSATLTLVDGGIS